MRPIEEVLSWIDGLESPALKPAVAAWLGPLAMAPARMTFPCKWRMQIYCRRPQAAQTSDHSRWHIMPMPDQGWANRTASHVALVLDSHLKDT